MCNHVFKPLWYVCDDDYGITTNKIHLENDNKGHLAYCTKCGQVFVREIAEKMGVCKVKKMSDFENKQDIIDSMAEKLMLNFRISPEKAYEVMESVLYPLKLLNCSEFPNNWIPCSVKKHPDKSMYCHVTVIDDGDYIVDNDNWDADSESWDEYSDDEIIAWMPEDYAISERRDQMTYKELYEKAVYKLEHNEITLGEFDKMIAPLNQEVREWIPVTPETLPEEGKMVLVQAGELYYRWGNGTGVVRGWHNGGYWSTYTASGYDRIRYAEAWMPLPEPYREGVTK